MQFLIDKHTSFCFWVQLLILFHYALYTALSQKSILLRNILFQIKPTYKIVTSEIPQYDRMHIKYYVQRQHIALLGIVCAGIDVHPEPAFGPHRPDHQIPTVHIFLAHCVYRSGPFSFYIAQKS